MCPYSVKLYVFFLFFIYRHYIYIMMVWLSSSHGPATIKNSPPREFKDGMRGDSYTYVLHCIFIYVCVLYFYRCINSQRDPPWDTQRWVGWQLIVGSVVIIGSLNVFLFFFFWGLMRACVCGHPVIFTWTSV